MLLLPLSYHALHLHLQTFPQLRRVLFQYHYLELCLLICSFLDLRVLPPLSI